MDPLSLRLDGLLLKRRRIMTSPIGSRAMNQECLGRAQRFGITPLVQIYALSQVNAAICSLRENRIRYRAVLIP